MLSTEQKRFLERLQNKKGDVLLTLESMGLEYQHFNAWRRKASFEKEYKRIFRGVVTTLKEENYIEAIRGLNTVLREGEMTLEIKEKRLLNDEGQLEALERTETRRFAKTVAWAIKEALKENCIERAIYTLAGEGVITGDTAQNILALATEYQEKLAQSFNPREKKSQRNDEKRIVDLVKQAVLGGSN